jgi:hypothetical protein
VNAASDLRNQPISDSLEACCSSFASSAISLYNIIVPKNAEYLLSECKNCIALRKEIDELRQIIAEKDKLGAIGSFGEFLVHEIVGGRIERKGLVDIVSRNGTKLQIKTANANSNRNKTGDYRRWKFKGTRFFVNRESEDKYDYIILLGINANLIDRTFFVLTYEEIFSFSKKYKFDQILQMTPKPSFRNRGISEVLWETRVDLEKEGVTARDFKYRRTENQLKQMFY